MSERKWFGREPALVIHGVGAVLTLLIAFNFPGLGPALAAALIAALTAVASLVTAMQVRPWAPSIFAGVIGAAAPLVAAFGLDLTQVQVGVVTAAVAALMAIWTRPQQTPVYSPAP